MGMIDMLCSSPASTATRRSHHETNNITPRLIRVLSTPCRTSITDVAKPSDANRYEYKQLLQKQKSCRIKSSSSCYGADGAVMETSSTGEHLRRKSSADASDIKVLSIREGNATSNSKFDRLIKKLSDSGTRNRSSSLSYDVHSQQQKQEVQQNVTTTTTTTNIMVSERSRSSTSSSRHLPPLKVASSGSPATTAVAETADTPKLKSSSSGYHGSTDKVVVLWVSLHCKGCEAKVRKHISKMEGVKTFSTDWMTKRVTIISNMDPHDVLASVSTVKYAQFWPSSSTSSSYYSPSPSSSSSSASLLTLTH